MEIGLKHGYMQQNFLELSVFLFNVTLGFIVADNVNHVTAVLSLLFLIAYRLPKFIFFVQKSHEMIKKYKKGEQIKKQELDDIYKDEE